MTIASAIAARTERIKIGIAVQVLPLCHPLRIAEEAATVDQVSKGRLIFGVGRSGLPRTYEAYGIPYAESKDRFTETLHVIEQAWSQPRFSYEGQYFNFDDVAVTPKPFQKPLPPIRVAASSPEQPLEQVVAERHPAPVTAKPLAGEELLEARVADANRARRNAW